MNTPIHFSISAISVYGGFGGPGGPGGQYGGSGGVGNGPNVTIHYNTVPPDNRRPSDEENRKILDWLSPFNFFQRQNDIFEACQKGSGQWFLSLQDFKTWLSSPQKVLWCEGIQGAGKTALSSLVINYIQKTYTTASSTGLAWIYLDYKEDQVQTKTTLLSSICHQLWVGKPMPKLLQSLYAKHLPQKTRPTLDDILGLLQVTLLGYSRIFLVIDALDEFSNPERVVFLQELAKIVMRFPVHLLITVRPHIVLYTYFSQIQRVEIGAKEEDITLYVEDQLKILPNVMSMINARPNLPQEIKQGVIRDVNGMFLLVKLRMASLAAQTNIESLLKAITELPEDLSAAYVITIERINSQRKSYKELALKALMWVANAIRPLTVAELCQALAVEPGDRSLHFDKVSTIEIILAACAGLVTIDKELSVARLVHYTAQDWLASWFPNAHIEIAATCFQYLEFSEFSNLERLDNEKYPLAVYAQYCLEHTGRTNCEMELITRVEQFASKTYLWQHLWRTLNWYERIQFWANGPWPEDKEDMQTLVLAGAGNLLSITQHLLRERQFDTRFYKCALSLAAYRGHSEIVQSLLSFDIVCPEWGLCPAAQGQQTGIVQMLLDNAADINTVSGKHETPLCTAVWANSEAIVKMLIDAGADMNVVCDGHGTALYIAVCRDSEHIVKMLIDAGADMMVGGQYGTPLYTAVCRDSEHIVKMLIDAGADMMVGGQYGTPLYTAVCRDSEHIVKMLIDAGADMQVGGQYGTPLYTAVCRDSKRIVKMLIDAGADMNVVCDGHRTALYTAICRDSEPIVKMLLDAGADMNIVGGEYGTALQAATHERSERIMKMLLDAGADTNIIAGQYGTALQAAAYMESEAIARMLLDAGADVNIVAGQYGTALQAAAYSESEPFVKMLFEMAPDMSNAGHQWGIALQAVAGGKSEPIVKLLLDAGADINIVGGEYGTALQVAAHWMSEPIVQLLLNAGADSNIAGGKYGTALQAAVAWNKPESESMVKLLLEAGANPHIEGGKYGSALKAAKALGQQAIEQMLLAAGALATDHDVQLSSQIISSTNVCPVWCAGTLCKAYFPEGDNEYDEVQCLDCKWWSHIRCLPQGINWHDPAVEFICRRCNLYVFLLLCKYSSINRQAASKGRNRYFSLQRVCQS
ncbi:Arp ankyrin repeat protein [Favolaschia claudopus]|uniref:Arp ankyrin repeat protein n=1 Tax=Favolaschia claudopus TaxID=2862362 RepID=A0AAV9ZGA2_9AGAR